MMKIAFTENAWEEYQAWLQTDKKVINRIHALIRRTVRNPFEGIGKPEPLRHQLSGYWSRRITVEHRMVYHVDGDNLIILQLRYHY